MSQSFESDMPRLQADPATADNFAGEDPSPVKATPSQPAVGAVAVQTTTYVDAVSSLVLPEGVQLASAGRRIGAYLLALPLAVVTLGIGYIIWGLVAWAKGQTPALQVLGMRCWRSEPGRVASWSTMALRETIGILVDDILGITLLVSFLLMLTRPDRRTLHDLVAGTIVVHDPDNVLADKAS